MEWNAFAHIPHNHHLTETHTYIHRDDNACMMIEMTTSSHPLNVLMSIFSGGGGGGGGIDHRVDVQQLA